MSFNKKLGSLDVRSINLGTEPIIKIYSGNEVIYTAEEPTPEPIGTVYIASNGGAEFTSNSIGTNHISFFKQGAISTGNINDVMDFTKPFECTVDDIELINSSFSDVGSRFFSISFRAKTDNATTFSAIPLWVWLKAYNTTTNTITYKYNLSASPSSDNTLQLQSNKFGVKLGYDGAKIYLKLKNGDVWTTESEVAKSIKEINLTANSCIDYSGKAEFNCLLENITIVNDSVIKFYRPHVVS